MSEAEDKIREAAERGDATRKDSEEIPAWADALMKSHKDVMDRLDAMSKEAADRKDAARKDGEKDEGEDPTENTDGKRKDEAEGEKREDRKDRKDREDRKDETMEAADRKDAEDKARKDAEEKERADRARSDAAASAQSRALQAKIAELEHQMKSVMGEPSIDDRNALADARAAADSLFQAALGRPVPEPIPGESPISYRKRLVAGLQKFSDKFKGERLDSLSGAVFDSIEQQVFADAAAAVKTPAVVPQGQLREIKSNQLGHQVTEYVGDPQAAWAPFGFGAGGKISINRALVSR